MQRPAVTAVLLIFTMVTLWFGLSVGSVKLSSAEVWQALIGNGSDVHRQIVHELRAPRVFAAFACGGLLAIAGTLLQVLLRNPLADPYILGISGGAAVGALCALSLGLAALTINIGALLGAMAAIALVFALGWRGRGIGPERMLLAGVVLSAGFAAIISLFLVLAPAAQLHGMLFWLMGDLSRVVSANAVLVVLAIVAAVSVLLGRSLDVLSLGEIKAATLGLSAKPLQIAIFFLAALAATAVVVTAGPIGFVGLLVPHAIRLLGITRHRALIVCSIFAGGTFLIWADLLARNIAAPLQLPVGAITALLGVPLLLILLIRR
jgi:iron complex transport system permease protein